MKYFKLKFIVAVLLILTSAAIAQINVIPKPKETSLLSENFVVDNSSIAVEIFLSDTSGLYIPLNELNETLKKYLNINVSSSGSKSIRMGIPDEDNAFKQLCEQNGINNQEKIGEEGYFLLIKKDLILISANSKAGIYYGVQTLKQIVRNTNNSSLPGIIITDWPSLKLRGILDDISRGPVPTMKYMKQQIRRLAELKMNSLQYYTEHVVKTEKHPGFAPVDGALTIDEIKELSDYAKKYHVTLIGNFQSFGHFEKILSNPEYEHLGEGGTLLSPAFPESIELLRDIYSELVPAYNSPYFNVNADETFDLGKGASKKMTDSLGVGVVYTNQVNKMYNILDSLGTRMMIWTDILLKNPGSLERMPEDVIMMTWGYDASDSFDDMILPVKEAGFDFTISPGVLNSYSTMPDFSVAFTNIRNFVRDGVKHGSMGMVLTVWDDGGSAFFSRDWYGVSYGAEQSWNPNTDDLSDFDTRFNSSVYGDETNNFAKAIRKLVELARVPASDRLQEKLLWTKVIPDSAEEIRIGTEGWDRVIQIADSAGIILNNAAPERFISDLDYFRFTINQYKYFANLRFNLLETNRLYSEAYSTTDNSVVRQKVIEAVALIGKTRESLAELYNDYMKLWLSENKTYSLDIALQRYSDQLNDLQDVENRILSALKLYDSRKPLPAPAEIRLGVEKGTGKYFREWMMINPITVENGDQDFSIDYLKNMGGELNAVPKVTQEFEYNGQTYRWRRTASDNFDIVDLSDEFPGETNDKVTYAFANIDSPDERTITAKLGSTGGVDVFLNGRLVHSVHKRRSLKIDEDSIRLPLKKGRNNLMLKMFNGEGEWKFTFRLDNEKISSSKNRYKIAE